MQKVIILCRPETSLNVGAVCRVMANTDCKELRIVGDKNTYNDKEVRTLALHANNIWENAKFFMPTIEGLRLATKDCNAVFATTRRVGAKRKHSGLLPNQFIEYVKSEGFQKIAIVFGNERTGLEDKELEVCSHAINIPSCPSYPSYNLSHAVLIICYLLFTSEENTIDNQELIIPLLKWQSKEIAKRERLSFYEASNLALRVCAKLKDMGLYRKGGSKDCSLFLSQMISRAKLTKEEGDYFVNIFQKIYHETRKEIEKTAKNTQNKKEERTKE